VTDPGPIECSGLSVIPAVAIELDLICGAFRARLWTANCDSCYWNEAKADVTLSLD
jgi:hypothetical protein